MFLQIKLNKYNKQKINEIQKKIIKTSKKHKLSKTNNDFFKIYKPKSFIGKLNIPNKNIIDKM